jgi:hypothetical protein
MRGYYHMVMRANVWPRFNATRNERLKMKDLSTSEADVVIVLTHSEGNVRVIPFWECDAAFAEMQFQAAQESLLFAEELGGGFVTADVQDRRPPAIRAPE